MPAFIYIYAYISGTPPHGPWFGELELCFVPVFYALSASLILWQTWGRGGAICISIILYMYVYIYIYKTTSIRDVRNDVTICHLTEFACISEYWDNAGVVVIYIYIHIYIYMHIYT